MAQLGKRRRRDRGDQKARNNSHGRNENRKWKGRRVVIIQAKSRDANLPLDAKVGEKREQHQSAWPGAGASRARLEHPLPTGDWNCKTAGLPHPPFLCLSLRFTPPFITLFLSLAFVAPMRGSTPHDVTWNCFLRPYSSSCTGHPEPRKRYLFLGSVQGLQASAKVRVFISVVPFALFWLALRSSATKLQLSFVCHQFFLVEFFPKKRCGILTAHSARSAVFSRLPVLLLKYPRAANPQISCSAPPSSALAAPTNPNWTWPPQSEAL